MKTITDFLEAIKKDNELNGTILSSEYIGKNYKPRNRRRKIFDSATTRSGIAVKHFWAGLDGAKFRSILETKYGVNLGDTRIKMALKTALVRYFAEVIGYE